MKELGDMTAYYHEEIGRFLKSSNIDMVMLIGEDVKGVAKGLNNGRENYLTISHHLSSMPNNT